MADVEQKAFMGITLKPHQAEAVIGAVKALETADRCKVIMACGTGKTFVAPTICQKLQVRNAILYVPSIALIRQTLREWQRLGLEGITFLCVCSDKTASRATDTITVSTDELRQEFKEIAVTTDADVVHRFLTGTQGRLSVVFSTYHSSEVVSQGCPPGFTFDIGFFDEAHNTAGKAGKVFGQPLQDAHTRIAKRVFMTATPKHMTFRKRRKHSDAEPELLYSMDNEELYGKDAYKLSIRDAISREIICDYRVLVSIVTDDLIDSSLLSQVDVEKFAHAVAIRKAIDKYGVSKIVTFHDTVKDAKSFSHSTAIREELGIDTFHVNGGMTAAVREGYMEGFRNASCGLITNSRCLTEGVDVPAIDMVAFLHPKGSRIDIVQALGRALRKGGDKFVQTGYILLPIYVPGELKGDIAKEVLEEAFRDFGYDFIFDVLEALREQDEIVNASIRTAVRSRVNRMPVEFGKFIEIEGNEEHLSMLRECIFAMCVDTLSYSWDVWMEHFRKYVDEFGNANVHHDYITPGGVRLGQKCMSLRQFFKAGKLEQSRIFELESIGFQWSPRDDAYENTFAMLKDFKDQYGTVNVPKGTIYKGIKLGNRCDQLRQDYRKLALPTDRIKRLEAIGFEWRLFDASFLQTIVLLKAYQAEFGKIDMTATTLYRGERLGARCNRLRQDKKKGKLTQHRIDELDVLGFKWSVLNVDTLGDDKTIQYLKKYRDEFQHVNVPMLCKYKDMSLGSRCRKLREKYWAGKLPAGLVAELDALGFRWQIKNRSTYDGTL